MSLVKLTLTKGEACAVGVALDTLIEQLTQPYDYDNREKLIETLTAQKTLEEAVDDAEENTNLVYF
tara:strand:- start:998 stop:1195 length:198 start_codon:yes stop_codon:yes gene_type:complete